MYGMGKPTNGREAMSPEYRYIRNYEIFIFNIIWKQIISGGLVAT